MRYFLSGVSMGAKSTNVSVNSNALSARCYPPANLLGMVLEQVDAQGRSKRVFVDRLKSGDKPIKHPSTQRAASGGSSVVTRKVPPLVGQSGPGDLTRRNAALTTISVAQIRVDTTPTGSNQRLMKTYFTTDGARTPVVLCKPVSMSRLPIVTAKKTPVVTLIKQTIPLNKKAPVADLWKAVQTAQANAETVRAEAERQAQLAQQATTIQEQQAALDRMAALLAEAERIAAEALAAANAAAARATSAEERLAAADAQKTAADVVATTEDTTKTASDVGVTSDGGGGVAVEPIVTPTEPDVVMPIEPEAELPPKKSKAPLFLLAAAAVGGYFWLNG